ncbi:TPA: hypothetical protein PXQ84_004440 [Yersinia enterocolitica]|nr:hypothetical protein [Yersinia enterocolitica]
MLPVFESKSGFTLQTFRMKDFPYSGCDSLENKYIDDIVTLTASLSILTS